MATEPLVCVVDDDEAVLDSLALLLEVEGLQVRTFSSATALLEALPPAAACIVSDVRMPGLDGLELLAILESRGAAVPVIMITGQGDVPMAVRAMQRGAVDFLEKPFDPDHLVEVVRRVVREQPLRAPDPTAARARLTSLTPREHEVLGEIVAGRSNKEIARALAISHRTVEIHRARVMEKTGAGSLAELVRLAVSLGIGPSTP